jgi:flagellar protein FlgJ
MENGPINRVGSTIPKSASSPGFQAPKLDKEKLKKACGEIESLFISQMLQFMRRTIPQSGLLGNGPGKDIYETLFDQELSKSLAKKGGMGLGNMIYKQMIKREEKNPPQPQELTPLQRKGKKSDEG